MLYAGIAASLALAWVIKPEMLLPLPFWPRLIAATLLAFIPIFLANVAFAKRFRASGDSHSGLSFAAEQVSIKTGAEAEADRWGREAGTESPCRVFHHLPRKRQALPAPSLQRSIWKRASQSPLGQTRLLRDHL